MNLFRTVFASSLFAITAHASSALAFEVETVDFQGPGTTTLSGVRYVPDDFDTLSVERPAVVLLHGCTGIWSNRTPDATNGDGTPNLQNHIEKWAIQLADAGYIALVVDSYTPRDPNPTGTLAQRQNWQNQCSGAANAAKVNPYTTRVLDTRAAYDYLTTDDELDGQVDADRIGLLGWSQGAQSAMVEIADAEKDTNVARSNGLFATTVVFYPGCGTDLGFGSTTSGWWRPAADFRMNIAKLDTLHNSCNNRFNRAVTLYNGVTNAPSLERTSYDGADHSFDGVSEDWPTAACVAPFSGDTCAMNDADIESFDFFESHL